MRHALGQLAAAVLVGTACPSLLAAQIRYNDILRATTRSGVVNEGRLLGADSAVITLVASATGDTVRVLRLDLGELERRDGTQDIHKVAAIVGVAVGAAVGAAAGAAARQHDADNGGVGWPNFPYRTVGALLGALGGALVGGLVGLVQIDRWQTMPTDAAFVQ